VANRAVLVGLNQYPPQYPQLLGCINDIRDMADFLVGQANFQQAEIRLLADDRATTDAIRQHLGWLTTGLAPGDRTLFHYSGHGSRIADRLPNGDVGQLHDCICPYDFDFTNDHAIRDVDFQQLFAAIPAGVHFVWISDSCHSGDLAKALQPANHGTSRRILPPVDLAWRYETALHSKGLVELGTDTTLNLTLLAGCSSTEESSDTAFNNRPNGAFTYFLLNELKSHIDDTALNGVIAATAQSIGAANYSQDPQVRGNPSTFADCFLGGTTGAVVLGAAAAVPPTPAAAATPTAATSAAARVIAAAEQRGRAIGLAGRPIYVMSTAD
jgi:hypothetical protein